jgi:hypothetical protein
VALRLWLSADLPLSQNQFSYDCRSSQFWDVLIEVGFGSQADSLPQFSRRAASKRKAELTMHLAQLAQYG